MEGNNCPSFRVYGHWLCYQERQANHYWHHTTTEKALYEEWEWLNRLSLMFIKTKISNGICGSVDQHDNVKALLKVIHEQFVTSD